jgi:hypothetical protein
VAITLNASNLWTVYLNGTAAGTYQDDSTHGNQATAVTTYLGNGYQGYFDGKADELRIYDRALGATEIGNLYALGAAKFQDTQSNQLTNGLIGYWPFNGPDISGTTAYDRAGSNNGTLTNGPTKTIGRSGQARRAVCAVAGAASGRNAAPPIRARRRIVSLVMSFPPPC